MSAIKREIDPQTGVISQHLDLIRITQTKWRRCPFGAPFMAVIFGKQGVLQQTCCDHWECPVCGDIRARQEYHRIVYGAEILAQDHELYFITLTCRGREMPLEEAEKNYYVWTNRLLTTYRTHIRRHGGYWAYVQVTERQKKTRTHPHSHLLVSAVPVDIRETNHDVSHTDVVSSLFSKWNESAGLGNQHRISKVADAKAVSRYVAKYLFKDAARDKFPPKWRRVRYSRNYPKPPARVYDDAFIVQDAADWQDVVNMGIEWSTNIPFLEEWLKIRFPDIMLKNGHVNIS